MDVCVVIYGSVNRWGLRGDWEAVLWRLEAENWKQKIESWVLKAFERIALGEKQVKASIAWDRPCYLFTFNHLIHIACVSFVANKDILDIWYLVPWYLWDIALGSFASA